MKFFCREAKKSYIFLFLTTLTLLTIAACSSKLTPLNPEGAPNFAPGSPASYWIWYDKEGWHLRTTTALNPSRFTGTITAEEGEITEVKLYNTEKKESAQLESPHKLNLDLYAHGNAVGVDFKSPAKCLYCDLKVDGKHYKNLIYVGKGEETPKLIPFYVCIPEKGKPLKPKEPKKVKKEEPPAKTKVPLPTESPTQLIVTEGKPTFGPASEARYWIWHDSGGWHLRTTTAGKVREFSGRIIAKDGGMENIVPSRKEGDDFKVVRLPSAFEFIYKSVGAVEGFDWQSNAFCLEFQLSLDGKSDPEAVRVGLVSQVPTAAPFTLCQQKPITQLIGKPKLKEKALGFMLWQDGEGWHLRTTLTAKGRKMEGTILHPGGGRGEVKATRGVKTDFALSGEDAFSFSFKARDKEEGFDWKPTNPCAVFDLKIDGEHRPTLAFIGSEGKTPEVIPFGLCH